MNVCYNHMQWRFTAATGQEFECSGAAEQVQQTQTKVTETHNLKIFTVGSPSCASLVYQRKCSGLKGVN